MKGLAMRIDFRTHHGDYFRTGRFTAETFEDFCDQLAGGAAGYHYGGGLTNKTIQNAWEAVTSGEKGWVGWTDFHPVKDEPQCIGAVVEFWPKDYVVKHRAVRVMTTPHTPGQDSPWLMLEPIGTTEGLRWEPGDGTSWENIHAGSREGSVRILSVGVEN